MWIACLIPERRSTGLATRSSHPYDERRHLLAPPCRARVHAFHFVAGADHEILLAEVDSPADLEAVLCQPMMAAWQAADRIRLTGPVVAGDGWSGELEEEGAEIVFRDAVTIAAPAEAVYRLLWDAARWPELLPHVKAVRMLEERPGFQRFMMETSGAAGTHITESVRESAAPDEIRFLQVTPPPLLRQHQGSWRLEAVPAGTQATAEHRIELAPERIARELGRPYSRHEAALLSRHFIGNHSKTTLEVVKARCEAALAAAPEESRR